MARSDTALDVLRRLNEARRIGQGYAAAMLEEQLEEIDARGGYQRSFRPEDNRPFRQGEKTRGRQRNPNWRAALDKLNAMRGRSA